LTPKQMTEWQKRAEAEAIDLLHLVGFDRR
jgi:hypothetical protein